VYKEAISEVKKRIKRVIMSTDWIFRVGDGVNFTQSSKHRIWGINGTINCGKHFIKNVKQGDRLWFVKNKSNGKILAVATYRSHHMRELGPLIDVSMTNEELGWTGEGPNWSSDIEIHYTDLYGLESCELLTHITHRSTIIKYDAKCKVDLPVEYSHIVRYSKIRFELV
jgi:hypothetical protein